MSAVWLKAQLSKIVSGLFDVKVLLSISTIIGGYVTYRVSVTDIKTDEAVVKSDSTQAVQSKWQARRDSANRVNFANQDTLKEQNRIIINLLNNKK